MVVEFPSDRREDLLPLFDNHPYLHALSEALLREKLGQAFSDALEIPHIALLLYRGLVFISGDASHPSVDDLLGKIPEKWFIIPPPGDWEDNLKKTWGDSLKSLQRTKFSSENLDARKMTEIQSNLPKGMDIEPVSIDSINEISQQAKQVILLIFPSLEAFMEKNFGFLIREEEKIISLALAASPLYSNEFEIHIETHPDYQRRGLAMISAAKLIQYSLEHGLIPHWDAENPPSAKLATKLGFTEPEVYNGYYWIKE